MKDKQKHRKKKNKSSNALLAVAAVLVIGLIAYVSLRSNAPVQQSSSSSIQRASLVQTLSPDLFSGRARDSYQAAKDVPEVLAEMPCYCGCMQNSGHKHNLDCFTDNHGAT